MSLLSYLGSPCKTKSGRSFRNELANQMPVFLQKFHFFIENLAKQFFVYFFLIFEICIGHQKYFLDPGFFKESVVLILMNVFHEKSNAPLTEHSFLYEDRPFTSVTFFQLIKYCAGAVR